MAKKSSNLFNRVVQLLGRGKNTLQVINAIRNTKGGKSINVRYIKAAISQYWAARTSGTKVGALPPKSPIGKALTSNSGKGAKTISVSFHFLFDFSSGGSSSRAGRGSVFMTVDVPATTTKGELLQILQQKVQDWIEQHYSDDPEGRNSVRIMIDSLRGV